MKKLSKLTSLLFCLATMALFQQCEKKDNPPPVEKLPQEFIDWMYFDKGTWWVYQDSISGMTDTVRVTESYFEVYDSYGGGKEVENRLNRFVYKTESSANSEMNSFGANDRCWGDAELDVDYTCFAVIWEETGNKLMFLGYPVGYTDGFTKLSARYDSLEVNNKMYYDVVVNHTPSQNSEGGMESWIYIAKGIGIVKERYKHKNTPQYIKVRELVSSHIVQ